MKTIAFFNNKGGVGKTSLVYHLAHMFALRGLRVIAADLDPQANLTSMFLNDEQIEAIWSGADTASVYAALQPLMDGEGDLRSAAPRSVGSGLHLLVGDLRLSEVEDELARNWPDCVDGKHRAFRVIAGFDRLIQGAAADLSADIGLIDVGPSLGAINRCAMIAADHVVIPIGADLFSIRGLQNVGPRLRIWRREWQDRRERSPGSLNFHIPHGDMQPLGYVISRYATRGHDAAKAYQRWLDRAPRVYAEAVLHRPFEPPGPSPDPNRLAQLKDYRSLMPMAQEARKPMFRLTSADGAIGGHQSAVQACFSDFEALAKLLEERLQLPTL